MSAAIVGAGSSGIAAAKVLHERGMEFDCFEQSDQLGGLWRHRTKLGKTAAYSSLHINSSRRLSAYSDFPMPADWPDFPHRSQMAAYFDAYVERFGFRDRVRFETPVRRVSREGDRWRVSLEGGESSLYDAVIVANGHHWDPRWPEPMPPGHFDGEMLHSSAYDTPEPFADRDVVVVGLGNSAVDIAAELGRVARSVILSTRRGAHIVPKTLFGRPIDHYPNDPRVPFALRRWAYGAAVRFVQGDMRRYGFPAPDHKFVGAHPTISDAILPAISHGRVKVKPGVEALLGGGVRFTDGSEAPAGVILWCTGYRVSFPFFDPEFLSAPNNELPLFHRIFHPDHPGLYFLGLLQPLGSTIPLAEAQAQWIADTLQGRYRLPPPEQMRARMERERREMAERYVRSDRHTMQVDHHTYLYEIRREQRRGRL